MSEEKTMFEKFEELVWAAQRNRKDFPVNVVMAEGEGSYGIINVSYGTRPPTITGVQLGADYRADQVPGHFHMDWPIDEGQFVIDVTDPRATCSKSETGEHDFDALFPNIEMAGIEDGDIEITIPLRCKLCGQEATSEVNASDGHVSYPNEGEE